MVLDPVTAQHASTMLKTRSVLRLHKLATLHTRNVVRCLGTLSAATSLEVKERLRSLLEL